MPLRKSILLSFSLAGLSLLAVAQTPDKSGVKPSVISLPSGPGSIEGLGESFEPQLNTGTSTYAVNFDVPPGRVGLQPSLGISYNSGLGNTYVGIGWSLSVPEIKRQTDKGFPTYKTGDTFLYNGEELVALSDGNYRCENETGFQRFKPIDSDSDFVPDAWEMTDKNGTRYLFGQYRGTAGRWSAVAHPNPPSTSTGGVFDTTYCWVLDTTIDLHGNKIEYEYIQGTGMLYLSRVSYSHNGANEHDVVFIYQNRTDVFDDYRPTFSVQIDRRLTDVLVRTGGSPVRSYKLDYQHTGGDSSPLPGAEQTARASAFDLGVSVLKKVTQYDRSGSHHLPPLIFHYSFLEGNLASASVQSASALPALDLANSSGEVQIADVNADGLPDIFSSEALGLVRVQRVCLNKGLDGSGDLRFSPAQLIANPSSLDLSQSDTSMADLQGDGMVDIVRVYDQFPGKRIAVYSNRSRLDGDTGQLGFDPSAPSEIKVLNNPPVWVGLGNTMTRQMDVNFDKISDFLYTESEFTGLKLSGYYQDADGSWQLFQTQTNIPSSATFESGGVSNPAVHLADMNGDRMQDFVLLQKNGTGFSATLTVRYWPYCSLGKWGAERIMQVPIGTTIPMSTTDMRDVFLQDFTGDGLADLLIMNGAGITSVATLRANIAGGAWSTPVTKSGLPKYRPRDGSSATIFRTADLNGNGSTDLIWRNTGFDNTWKWLDLMPDAGKPNLLTRIDNSLGKMTTIQYGNAHEDYIRAQDTGHPWISKIPFAVQVVRRMITTCGYDLNGDGQQDALVSEFKYRDGFYDGFEKEFRGFSFAERIDYGDDFLWNAGAGTIGQSSGWDVGKTPTGQLSGPSLVTRYRFHTGAADQQDNDEAPPLPAIGLIDEFTLKAGREEECLKGKQLLEEKVDARVLHGSVSDFDTACAAASAGGNLYASITPDTYVYQRARQFWGVRRLYRPTETFDTWADSDANGSLSYYGDVAPSPSGRFTGNPVINGDGRSVSFAFVQKIETDIFEANGLLSGTLGYSVRAGKSTGKEFDYDDYGNATLEYDHGLIGGGYDDERKTVTSYALGGQALTRWVISKPDTITTTDENGIFVNKTVHFYDGAEYVGVQGSIGNRALLHRVQKYIDAGTTIDEQRSKYDAYGNVTGMRDADYGTAHGVGGGHERIIAYDTTYNTYPVTETIKVGGGSSDLVMNATYDLGFGVVESSTDFNNNLTDYEYDFFARLVAVAKPGDTVGSPTHLYEYQPFDPWRGQLYSYARSGALTKSGAAGRASRVITHARETAGGGVYTTVSYTDGCGKSIAEVGEDEEAGKWVVAKATSYNLRGVEAATWLPYQVSAGGIPTFSAIWPNGRPPASDGINPSVVKSDTYSDSLGRSIMVIQPPETWSGARKMSQTRILPFEKQLFDENDSDSGSEHADTPLVHFEDGLGRLVKVHEVVKLTDTGETGALATWETNYRYDLNDKLEHITDSQGNIKHMDYDGLGRLVSMNDPDRGMMDYIYSPASNLVQTTDAKGQVIKYTYDGVNRIKTEDYLDTTAKSPDVEYFYDAGEPALDLGNGSTGISTHPKGQLTYVKDLTGEEHFSYDARGRMVWQVKRIPDRLLSHVLVSYQTSYAYDSLDRVTTLTYPDGDQIGYGYNARNLLESIDGETSGAIVSDLDYLPSSQLSGISYGNGVDTSYAYDPRLRLRELKTQHSTLGTSLIDFEYTFDPANNITRIDDIRSLSGQPDAVKRKNTQVFTYDSLYRLKQVVYPSVLDGSPGQISYRYDRIGNMIKKESDITHVEKGKSITHLGDMSYGGSAGASGRNGGSSTIPGPHALTSLTADGGRSYPYDANGNMTYIDGLTCGWDFKDRMTSAENDKMSARYHYDYTDRRVLKEVTPKTGQMGAGIKKSTIYVNKYFEVRPGEPPVKYVWSGSTRVARITKAVKPTMVKNQRLRVRQGWNLCTITVGGAGGQMLPASHPLILAAAWWDKSVGQWQSMGTPNMPAHTPVWLYANADGVVSISGTRAPPEDVALASGQGGFLCNCLDAPVDLSILPNDAHLWHWNAVTQQWDMKLPGDLAGFSDSVPAELEEGAAMFVRAGMTPATVDETPEPTLQLRFYHQDHLGSSSVITDQDGALVEEVANYPFGHPRHKYKPRGIEESYGFTQKEQDAESDLHYFEARYHVASLGRFNRVDPLLSNNFPRSFLEKPTISNAYTYSASNPIVYSDPNGEHPILLLLALGGAVSHIGPASPDTCKNNPSTCGDKPTAVDVVFLGNPIGRGLGAAGKTVGRVGSNKITKNVMKYLRHQRKPVTSSLTGEVTQLSKKSHKIYKQRLKKSMQSFKSGSERYSKFTGELADEVVPSFVGGDAAIDYSDKDAVLSLGKGPLSEKAFNEEKTQPK